MIVVTKCPARNEVAMKSDQTSPTPLWTREDHAIAYWKNVFPRRCRVPPPLYTTSCGYILKIHNAHGVIQIFLKSCT